MDEQILIFSRLPYQGLERKVFASRAKALAWLNAQKNIIQHKLMEKNPSSKEEKPVVQDLKMSEFLEFEGRLALLEAEDLKSVLAFKRKNSSGQILFNPDFNIRENISPENQPYYKTDGPLVFLSEGLILKLNSKLILLKNDPDFERADGGLLSFYPRGFSKKELLELFFNKTPATLFVKRDF